MNLQKMIAELQAERARLDEAILALERLSTVNTKRRGRPPKWSKNPAREGANSPEITPRDETGEQPA